MYLIDLHSNKLCIIFFGIKFLNLRIRVLYDFTNSKIYY